MTGQLDQPVDLGDTARRVLPLIDLTSLGQDDRPETIDALCAAAETDFGPVAAVCVWPRFVAQAVDRLANTAIGVAAVANFPEGDTDLNRATSDAVKIVEAGGGEVDVVYPWRALVDGDVEIGERLVAATRAAIGPDVVLKVILETGELADEELIHKAAVDAVAGGADYLKTSTGKTARSASPEAVRCLLSLVKVLDRAVGIKVSGGVRTVAEAAQYLAIADEVMGPQWVQPAMFRFGASSLLGDVIEVLDDL